MTVGQFQDLRISEEVDVLRRRLADEDWIGEVFQPVDEILVGGKGLPGDQNPDPPAMVGLRTDQGKQQRPQKRVVPSAVSPDVDDDALHVMLSEVVGQAFCKLRQRFSRLIGDPAERDVYRTSLRQRLEPENLVLPLERQGGAGSRRFS